MDDTDAKSLRALDLENAALTRLVGALTLDNRRLKDVREKTWVSLAAKRRAAAGLKQTHHMSEQRACLEPIPIGNFTGILSVL